VSLNFHRRSDFWNGRTIPSEQDSFVTIENELDLDLLTFVERYATTPVRWDLVVFFGCKPQRQETVEAIAHQMGWRFSLVHRELDELVMLGLLEQIHNNGGLLYRLTRYKPLREAALRFAARFGQVPSSNGAAALTKQDLP
jgi:DNA-binding MarR family transcriptional regulator